MSPCSHSLSRPRSLQSSMSCPARLALTRKPAFSSSAKHRDRAAKPRPVHRFAIAPGEKGFTSPAVDGRTEYVAETQLPTRNGRFRLRGYRHTVDNGKTWTEPTAMIFGKPEGGQEVPVRVHDACFTSEVLGSLKCDCAEQLQLALAYIRDNSPGIVIYLQQEGRGIGLANKIAAYSLQEKGFDTVDANRQLGLPDDAREYTSVKNILSELNISSIKLITNNPRKIRLLEALGVVVTGRIPCLVKPGEFSQAYLEAKGRRMDHLDLDGDWCYWDHSGEKEPAHPPRPIDEQTF